MHSKLLNHLLRQNNNEDRGFTLIELLVVIIIIGILAAIALPSFLNQASKARQAEAKTNLGALTRGQQAHRLERREFAPSVSQLALGVRTSTENYLYGPDETVTAEVGVGTEGQFQPVNEDGFGKSAQIYARSQDLQAVKDYIGATAASIDESGNATTITLICEANRPADQDGAEIPTIGISTDDGIDDLDCESESVPIGG